MGPTTCLNNTCCLNPFHQLPGMHVPGIFYTCPETQKKMRGKVGIYLKKKGGIYLALKAFIQK